MDMSGPNDFGKLTCSCTGEDFSKVSNLLWKEGGGVVEKVIGYDCMKCKRRMSTDAAISRARKNHLQAQMNELNEQQKMNDDVIKASEAKNAERTVPNKTA